MKYRLTVTHFQEPTVDELSPRFRPYPVDHVPMERGARTLEVELTEAEWQAVKRAVIETM